MRKTITLAALLALSPAGATQLPYPTVSGLIDSQLPTNSQGLIQTAPLRAVLHNMLDSVPVTGALYPSKNSAASYTYQVLDQASSYVFTAATPAITLQKPGTPATPNTISKGWWMLITAGPSSSVTITPTGSTISVNGGSPGASLNIVSGASAIVSTDGVNYFATTIVSGGSGNVSLGTVGQLAYYPSSGTTVAGLNSGSAGQVLTSEGAGSTPLWITPGSSNPVPNASGSQATGIGTISSSSASLALTAAGDWVNGEGISILHVGASFSGGTPTGLTIGQVGTSGGTTYSYTISCLDAHGGYGAAITAVPTTTGNATLTGLNYNTLSWTAATGCLGYGIYRGGVLVGATAAAAFNDNGGTMNPRPAFMASAAPSQNEPDTLLTTISSGGGTTTLTLAAAATNGVSGAAVFHDDTAAINAAVGALPASGGNISIPAGGYNISSTINLGNGTGPTSPNTSTRIGQILTGASLPGGWGAGSGVISGTQFYWEGLPGVSMISVNGQINAWGVDNIALNCTDAANGLVLIDAQYGHANNDAVRACKQGVVLTTYLSNSSGSAFNEFRNWYFQIANNDFTVGLNFEGTSQGDSYSNVFYNLIFEGGGTASATTANGTAIHLGGADDNSFFGVHIDSNPFAIQFDYTVSASWPASNMFFNLDPETRQITNAGTPSGAATNIIWGLAGTNGATCPSLANLSCHSN